MYHSDYSFGRVTRTTLLKELPNVCVTGIARLPGYLIQWSFVYHSYYNIGRVTCTTLLKDLPNILVTGIPRLPWNLSCLALCTTQIIVLVG